MADGQITRFDRERAVIYGGWLAKMTHLERGVWTVLMTESNYYTGYVSVKQEDLSFYTGCRNFNRLRAAYQRLEQYGLAETVNAGGGYGEKAVRRMLAPKPLWQSPLFDQAEALAALTMPDESDAGGALTGPLTGPVVDENYRAGRRIFTGPVGASYRAGQRRVTGPVSGPPFNITHNSPPPHTATGPISGPVSRTRGLTPEEEEVRKFLKGKGIWESSATKYARLVQLAKAEEIWRGVVSDAGVKKRSHALFARIRELVDNETPGQSAQAS